MANRTNNLKFRKAIAVCLTAVACAPGCASMKMPFAKSELADPPTFASAATSAGSGISGQIKSMGSAMSSAMGKAKSAVTSTFTSQAR